MQCKIRGAPISVSVHGRREFVNGKPRSALNTLFGLWLAAAKGMEFNTEREGEEGTEEEAATEVRQEGNREVFVLAGGACCRCCCCRGLETVVAC